MGEYAVVARRKGNTWYVAAMTNWTARHLTIDCSFLGDHRATADIFADGINAAAIKIIFDAIGHYKPVTSAVGRAAAEFVPMDRRAYIVLVIQRRYALIHKGKALHDTVALCIGKLFRALAAYIRILEHTVAEHTFPWIQQVRNKIKNFHRQALSAAHCIGATACDYLSYDGQRSHPPP